MSGRSKTRAVSSTRIKSDSVTGADGPSTKVSTFALVHSFRLTSYNPDDSAYSKEEWLSDATKITDEINISDNLMIAQASYAPNNRG